MRVCSARCPRCSRSKPAHGTAFACVRPSVHVCTEVASSPRIDHTVLGGYYNTPTHASACMDECL